MNLKFEVLTDWIAGVEDKVKRTINDMKVFMKVREMRLLAEHNAGVKTITVPAGVDVVLQEMEATTNTQSGLSNDTVKMCGTLTSIEEDAMEPRFMLRPKDVSGLIAVFTRQLNPRFDKLADHPDEAGAKIGKKWKKHKVRAGGHCLPRLMDIRTAGVQVVGDNQQLASC